MQRASDLGGTVGVLQSESCAKDEHALGLGRERGQAALQSGDEPTQLTFAGRSA